MCTFFKKAINFKPKDSHMLVSYSSKGFYSLCACCLERERDRDRDREREKGEL